MVHANGEQLATVRALNFRGAGDGSREAEFVVDEVVRVEHQSSSANEGCLRSMAAALDWCVNADGLGSRQRAMETAQHRDRLAKNQPAEIAMFQISEVQESPAFNGRRSLLALRGRGTGPPTRDELCVETTEKTALLEEVSHREAKRGSGVATGSVGKR